jgi:hypothetical protein
VACRTLERHKGLLLSSCLSLQSIQIFFLLVHTVPAAATHHITSHPATHTAATHHITSHPATHTAATHHITSHPATHIAALSTVCQLALSLIRGVGLLTVPAQLAAPTRRPRTLTALSL